MSTLAEALATRLLTPFENKDVIRSAIEIPGAAGGLREAMKFDPVEIAHDQELVLVMKVRCKKVRFDEIPDTDCLARVHVLEPLPEMTSFIDESLVAEVLAAQQDRLLKAREEAAGIQRLPVDDEANGKAPKKSKADKDE